MDTFLRSFPDLDRVSALLYSVRNSIRMHLWIHGDRSGSICGQCSPRTRRRSRETNKLIQSVHSLIFEANIDVMCIQSKTITSHLLAESGWPMLIMESHGNCNH